MATIQNNLKKMHAAVIAQRYLDGESALAKALNEAGVAAATGGINSPAWKSYMAVFADNPVQLERLTVEKPPKEEPEYLKQLRAYMVSNAICDASTNGHTNNNVGPRIDGTEGTNDPPVTDVVEDPGNVIRDLRPEGLKTIPTVIIQPA
jgi:hypothetical protein